LLICCSQQLRSRPGDLREDAESAGTENAAQENAGPSVTKMQGWKMRNGKKMRDPCR